MGVGIGVAAAVTRLALTRIREHRGGNIPDIADHVLAARGGYQVQRSAGLPRSALDHGDQPAQAAGIVLLRQAVDLGIDGGDDLVVQDCPGVPGDVAERQEGAEGEDRQIGDRQLERRGPEQFLDPRADGLARDRLDRKARAHPVLLSSKRST